MPQTPGTNQWVVSSAIDFQTALTALETNSTLNTIVLTRDITTAPSQTGFKLPKKIAHPTGKVLIQGNNSTISAKVGQTTALLGREFTLASPPATNSDLFDQIVIQDLNFNGQNAASSGPNTIEGILIEAASNIIIDNCNFHALGYGVVLRCVNVGMVSNCVTDDIFISSYVTTSSTTWNSTAIYSQLGTYTRNITFNKCKSHLNLNAAYGFWIEKSANVVMNDCIASGSRIGTTHHVLFDSQGGLLYGGNELINNFNIYNITIETGTHATEVCAIATPSPSGGTAGVYLGSLIRIKAAGSLTASGSYVKIDGLHLHPGVLNSTMVDASSGKGFTTLYVYNIPYMDGGGQFATDGGVILANINCAVPPTSGTVWEFKETYDANNIFGSGRWRNGIVPYYRLSDNFSSGSRSKKYLTNYMMINNKIVSQ